MTPDDFRWLIGISASLILSIAGIAWGAFRSVSNKIDTAVGEMRASTKTGDDQLHERVNRLRQDVSDNYVRRADLDSHMKRIDETLKELRDDQKTIIKSLAVLEAKPQRNRSA